MPPDLRPAATRLGALVAGVPDEALANATPCPDYSLGDLLDHVGGLAVAFTAAAAKTFGEDGGQGPSGDASRLEDGWRERIQSDLEGLAEAWRAPEAWDGMTQAGGIDLPGEVAGLVALDELVVHGWDVARASGQDFACDEASLEAVHGFVSQFSGPGQEAAREGLFGPEVAVPEAAPLVDRVIGMTGRQPGWSAPRTGRGSPVLVPRCTGRFDRIGPTMASTPSEERTHAEASPHLPRLRRRRARARRRRAGRGQLGEHQARPRLHLPARSGERPHRRQRARARPRSRWGRRRHDVDDQHPGDHGDRGGPADGDHAGHQPVQRPFGQLRIGLVVVRDRAHGSDDGTGDDGGSSGHGSDDRGGDDSGSGGHGSDD